MRKDSIFWSCMTVNMVALLLLVVLKPQVHLLPVLVMTLIIKIEMALQVGLGFYGVKTSVDPKLFSLFAKIYTGVIVTYIVLKFPALNVLSSYFIDAREIFSPFPFVLVWIMDKAFYKPDEQKETP